MVLGPGTGDQACGETGDGRMLEPHELLAEIIAFFQPKRLSGKRVLITAGPTSERVDPVRVISNRSSGKTGYAIARAAYEAGANVTLVSGPTALACPYGVKRINVESAREMHTHVMGQAQHADIFISVAAVADWHVSNASEQKLKKARNGQPQPPSIEFAPNPDILAEVAALENGPWCVGFAAETENLHEYAQAKRYLDQYGEVSRQWVIWHKTPWMPTPQPWYCSIGTATTTCPICQSSKRHVN